MHHASLFFFFFLGGGGGGGGHGVGGGGTKNVKYQNSLKFSFLRLFFHLPKSNQISSRQHQSTECTCVVVDDNDWSCLSMDAVSQRM